MKNYRLSKFLLAVNLSFFFLVSCAKPTVVNTIMPNDNKLNCEELELAVAETQRLKKEAEYAKQDTGGNIARIMLFWPAWAKTLSNADEAIMAANNRNFHLINLMKKKRCKSVDLVNAKISRESLSNNVATQLLDLKKMYHDGDLTKEEYKKAKKKLLD